MRQLPVILPAFLLAARLIAQAGGAQAGGAQAGGAQAGGAQAGGAQAGGAQAGGAAQRYAARRTFRRTAAGRAWSKRFRVDDALAWLERQQDADGGYAGDGRSPLGAVGRTGLPLLVFLGDGSTMRLGPHRDAIKKCVLWLRRHQSAGGRFTVGDTADAAHAIATLAMTEAHGLSSYRTIRKNAASGGDVVRGLARVDSATVGWELLLHHCRAASGMDGFAEHLRRTARPALRLAGEKRSRALLLPVGMLLGSIGPDAAPENLGKRTPDTGTLLALAGRGLLHPEPDESVLYFGTLAMRAHGGPDAKRWLEALDASIERTQHKDGSWGPRRAGKGVAGKVYSTAMTLLILQGRYDGRLPGRPATVGDGVAGRRR